MKYTITVDTGLRDSLFAREEVLDAAVQLHQDLIWALDSQFTGFTFTVTSEDDGVTEVLYCEEIPLTDSSREGTIGS